MIDCHRLLSRYGSPVYLYDLAEVRTSYMALRAALPAECALYYSLKANPCTGLVRELHRLTCQAEVSSLGELQIALQAGCSPDQCLYTGPGKSSVEIDLALQRGVRLFSIESPLDLEKVSKSARDSDIHVNVLLRVNADQAVPGLGLAMTGVASPFGTDTSTILKNPHHYQSTRWASVIGFHLYMGTNTTDLDTLLETFNVSLDQVNMLSEVLALHPKMVDLGGGFGHPFAKRQERPQYMALRPALEALLTAKLPGWQQRNPSLAFESGRYLVAKAGTLLCTVQDVKVSKEMTFVVLDSGIHHLGGMSGIGRMFRIEPDALTLIPSEDTDTSSSDTICAGLVGPLCTPLDSWSRRANLPRVKPGDIISIPNVGAYGLTASLLSFLSRECPVEIILDGTEVLEASQLVVQRIPR